MLAGKWPKSKPEVGVNLGCDSSLLIRDYQVDLLTSCRFEMSDIVETLYPYQSDQGQGLSFEAGMKISVQERGENGWWKGSLLKNDSEDGQPEAEGWFPASYVDEKIETSLEEVYKKYCKFCRKVNSK